MALSALGEVDIPNGEDGTVTLRCTLYAWETVNTSFGSYTDAFKRVASFDSGAYSAIIAAGLGKPMKDVKAIVFQVGMVDLAGPLSEFLELLSNGGKRKSTDDTDKDSKSAGER